MDSRFRENDGIGLMMRRLLNARLSPSLQPSPANGRESKAVVGMTGSLCRMVVHFESSDFLKR